MVLNGEMELVLFDPRPESPTCGQVFKIVLSEHNRCLVNVPINVWHADHNIGTCDVLAINFPTTQSDPRQSRQIPAAPEYAPDSVSFGAAAGW